MFKVGDHIVYRNGFIRAVFIVYALGNGDMISVYHYGMKDIRKKFFKHNIEHAKAIDVMRAICQETMRR